MGGPVSKNDFTVSALQDSLTTFFKALKKTVIFFFFNQKTDIVESIGVTSLHFVFVRAFL